MKKFQEQSRACDQCNMRRTRCTRQLPVCHACESRNLTCSWNRQLGTSNSNSYQNVETFSSTNQGKRYTKVPKKPTKKPVSTFKHYSFITRSLVIESTDKCDDKTEKDEEGQQKFPSLLVRFGPTVWSMALRKWLTSSASRQDFYVVVKMSGVRLDEATRQDHKFLSHILLNRVAPDPISTKVLLQVDTFTGTNSLLNLAVDAYFHFFNPFCFLFTRHNFNRAPRSQLLRLTVWRAGLQFTSPSPQRNALAETLDNLIASQISLSQLRPSLDTLQSLLIIGIGIGMASSARLHNKWPFFNIILSLVHQLGLHVSSNQSTHIQLERVLAYRVSLFWDSQRVWSLGFPFFVLGTYFSTKIQLARVFVKTSSQLFFNHGTLSNVMDLCGLITSECLGNCGLSLLKLHQIQLKAKRDNNHLLPQKAIGIVLQECRNIYMAGSSQLRAFRKYAFSNNPATGTLQAFDQALCFLGLNHHFSQLQILDFATQVSADMHYVLKGLSNAISAISIIGRIGKEPFLFVRVNPLSCAFHFIVRYYHTYSSAYNELTAPSYTPGQLVLALAEAFNILQELKSSNLHGYHASSASTMFRALLNRYKITLPHLEV